MFLLHFQSQLLKARGARDILEHLRSRPRQSAQVKVFDRRGEVEEGQDGRLTKAGIGIWRDDGWKPIQPDGGEVEKTGEVPEGEVAAEGLDAV